MVLTSRIRSRVAFGVCAVLALVTGACSGDDQPAVQAEQSEVSATATPFLALDAPPDPNAASAANGEESAEPVGPPLFNGDVQILAIEVLETLPHDPLAYTQGLLVDDGVFLESTGQRYESNVRRVDISTGEVLQSSPAPQDYFGEGLARVGDELIQLTWRDGRAVYWNAETLELNREVEYTGEGWGLCYDGERLIMTDGSPILTFRDPASFEILGSTSVTWNGQDVHNLNELECVDGKVWANVWQTDLILRIEPDSGIVEAVVDASSLAQPRPEGSEVLNGIAYDPATDSFYLTGKYWPTMHRVNFVSATVPGDVPDALGASQSSTEGG